MIHFHYKKIDSTQALLKDFVQRSNPSDQVLISCENQEKGSGRGEKTWISVEDSLAFSFTLTPNRVITLTSLEIGILLTDFFQKHYNVPIKLKWPNDLINDQGKKVGGILITALSCKLLIVGIGLNFFLSKNSSSKLESYQLKNAGHIVNSSKQNFSTKNFQEDLPKKILSFVNSNRLGPSEVRLRFNQKCYHIGKKVKIGHETGIFKNIGSHGEALLYNQEKNTTSTIISGSLIIQA